MEILLVKAVSELVLPPGLMIVMMLLGLSLKKRYPRSGTTLFSAGFTLLILASLPVIANFTSHRLEREAPLAASELTHPTAEAIVVLGGGRIRNSPEYGHDIASSSALLRLHYAAYLHRHTGLPILLTGGNVFNTIDSEASLMREVLEKELSTPVRWVEEQSRNTWENALFSQAMLQKEGIERVYVVTEARHMLRSRIAFESNGLKPIPAPTGFTPKETDRPILLQWIPGAGALGANRSVMHELLGILWYKLRYIRDKDEHAEESPAENVEEQNDPSASNAE